MAVHATRDEAELDARMRNSRPPTIRQIGPPFDYGVESWRVLAAEAATPLLDGALTDDLASSCPHDQVGPVVDMQRYGGKRVGWKCRRCQCWFIPRDGFPHHDLNVTRYEKGLPLLARLARQDGTPTPAVEGRAEEAVEYLVTGSERR